MIYAFLEDYTGDRVCSKQLYAEALGNLNLPAEWKITWNDAAFWQIQGVTKPVTNCVKWPFKTEIPSAELLRL